MLLKRVMGTFHYILNAAASVCERKGAARGRHLNGRTHKRGCLQDEKECSMTARVTVCVRVCVCMRVCV